MTDPLSLAPVLAPDERPAPLFADPDLTHEERYDAFVEHVHSGKKVEARDWMPDEYRTSVLRFVEMHANSELMGVLPEREWIMRAPTLKRKLALTAKVQDECGHAQLLYRVAEDLGKSREQMYQDLLDGKTKFHNVFHYPTESWGDVGIIAWLVDAAAIVAQQALRESSYGPYSRTMKKICWEESVHIMHGRDVVITMMNGSKKQQDMVQEALDRWWGPLMQMHGPRTDPAKDRDLYWRIKEKTGEQLRQEFLSTYVPRLWEIGLFPPDAELKLDEARGEWRYTEPDWQELRTVVTGHGPKSQERLDFRRMNHDQTAWVRQTILSRTSRGRLGMSDQQPSAEGRHDTAGKLGEGARSDIFEVFRQEKDGDAMRHAGNVTAPDIELATHYAREFYSRRQESVRLWVVPREQITDLADPDLLQPPLDRSFKKPGGYVMRDKLEVAKKRAKKQADK